MSKLTLLQLIAAAALICAGCANQLNPRQINLADGIYFDLLPPASFGDTLALTQHAEIHYDGETREMLFVTEVDDSAITVIGLMPNGTRLFSISYDGQTIRSDSWNPLLNSINPRYLLADFQLSRWPMQTLEQQLQRSSTCFDSGLCMLRETADHSRRQLLRNGDPIISITYGDQTDPVDVLEFWQHERDYRLNFITLQAGRIE